MCLWVRSPLKIKKKPLTFKQKNYHGIFINSLLKIKGEPK